MRHISVFAVLLLLLLPGCDEQTSLQGLEKDIRAEVVSESAGIATLQGTYTVSYLNYKKNLITSDDIYIQKDIANIDYGFVIDENDIRVIAEGPKKILQVRLDKGKRFSINRETTHSESTHDGYRPEGEGGLKLDIDAEINKEIEAAIPKYEEENLKLAADNIKNFFKVIAERYDLILDFKVAE